MTTDASPDSPDGQPRWLDAEEQKAWRAWLYSSLLLQDQLDNLARQLEREPGDPSGAVPRDVAGELAGPHREAVLADDRRSGVLGRGRAQRDGGDLLRLRLERGGAAEVEVARGQDRHGAVVDVLLVQALGGRHVAVLQQRALDDAGDERAVGGERDGLQREVAARAAVGRGGGASAATSSITSS